MDKHDHIPEQVSAYMAEMGARGGRIRSPAKDAVLRIMTIRTKQRRGLTLTAHERRMLEDWMLEKQAEELIKSRRKQRKTAPHGKG